MKKHPRHARGGAPVRSAYPCMDARDRGTPTGTEETDI